MGAEDKQGIEPGSLVRIEQGPYKGCIATVERIDLENARMRVLISFFGRQIHAEVTFRDVERK